ncbi:hypothetical protein [Streptosporangium minutum]|uniref:Uncharacterized protein n=1 Tax=Streptosporangium minutum TaxID=569862 RepID=A0A243RTR3_9ACTN|nr:hypothetical protein [Streptosporangium minutum]OUC98434.1 hypothetical protein CA984_07280 [Streptosporangium minutum]
MIEKIRAEKPALRRAAYLGAALLAVVLVVSLIWAEDLRFTHSAGNMEAVARTLGEGVELRDQSIGSLSFEFVRRENAMVYFYRGKDRGGNGYGYVWSPASRPGDVRHVEGPWYEFRDDAHQ